MLCGDDNNLYFKSTEKWILTLGHVMSEWFFLVLGNLAC